jgi:hypothetical protein
LPFAYALAIRLGSSTLAYKTVYKDKKVF